MARLSVGALVRTVTVTGVVLAAVAVLLAPAAAADPLLPGTASQAEQQLAELGHRAEVLNEQFLGAEAAAATAHAQQVSATAAETAAAGALRDAQSRQQQFRGTVDGLTAATYEGARLNRLSALLVSRSPQDLLDRMSGLDLLATDTTTRVRAFTAATGDASAAKAAADAAVVAAKRAETVAVSVQADLKAKQAALATQTQAVRAQYANLTQAQRISYAGAITPAGFVPPVPPITQAAASAPAAASPGSPVGVRALQFALGKLGAPYQWGAAGPDSFDCSGLTSWSFRQAGLTIPRTAQAQAAGGTPVSRDALQPGDLVFFYSPISHVSIYVGNGNVVHALTEGQPVKVSAISTMPYITARRY